MGLFTQSTNLAYGNSRDPIQVAPGISRFTTLAPRGRVDVSEGGRCLHPLGLRRYSHTCSNNLSTHNLLTHMLTQLVHTQLVHAQLVLTQLAHTQLTHTQQPHTLSTHTHTPHIRLHMQLVHTHRCLRSRRGAWRHRASLCVAGVALGDMDLHFAWQARHFWHWTGSGGALGLLGDIERRFAWQAWHLATPPLCVAGVARMALGWLWWRAWGGFGAVDAAGVFTPLCDTPCFTHYLSHTIFDTPSFIQLCHTPSFTHNFVTPSLSHTTLTHTTFHTPLCHTHHL